MVGWDWALQVLFVEELPHVADAEVEGFAMDTCNNGEERAFVVTGQYDRCSV